MYSDLVNELGEASDDELTERFRSLELQRRSVEAEMAAIVREGGRRSIESIDGHRSMKHWVRAQTNCPASDAARLCRLSRASFDLPEIGEALRAGHIGVAQANELARVRSNPRCGDQLETVSSLLLEHAEHLSFEEFRIVTKRWETLADLDGAERDDEASHERRNAGVVESNGSIDVRATGGTGAIAAEMMAIFDRFVQAEFDADVAARTQMFGSDAPASALPRTDAQRRFDALVEIFRAAVVAPADGVAPEPVVNLVVGLATFERLFARRAGATDATDRDPIDPRIERIESSSGITVSPDDVVAATLSGFVRRVVIDSAGVVVDAGRKRRLFTGVAREMALLQWHGCGHLGCTVPGEHCDIDHMQEWAADDGSTDQDNARPRCSCHNPWKSKHGLRTARDSNGHIVDIRADGTPMVPVGRRTATSEAEPIPDGWDPEHVLRISYCRLRTATGRAALARHLRTRSTP